MKKSVSIFNNKLKIKAILDTSVFIYQNEVLLIKDEIRIENVDYLGSFPFFGELLVTISQRTLD